MSQFNYLNLMFIISLVLGAYWCVESAPFPKTIRLCSKGLSDALYLVCWGRGYNEPVPYTGGRHSKRSRSYDTGLVEECCHQSCSLQHLQLYCKPLASGENSNEGIEESLRIVNLSFSPSQTVSIGGVANEPIQNSIESFTEESP
ncbi:insulin-like growth factor I [Diachasma alloeum]|uniref:insulin-like growth factor I n=1 Tax=Diachasma alloeum TaxID=454923 RepID=UPI0007384D15|nr:insulin-like growth factor I [Diachasma alloeum]